MVMQRNKSEGNLEAENCLDMPVVKSMSNKKRHRRNHRRRAKLDAEFHAGKMPSIFENGLKSQDNRTLMDKTVSNEHVILPKLPDLEVNEDYKKLRKTSKPSLSSNLLPPINDGGSFTTTRNPFENYEDKLISFPVRHPYDQF